MNTINKILLGTVTVISSFAISEAVASKGNCKEEPDVLLILGCTVHGDKPCNTLITRIEAAAKYLKEHPSVICIPCGGIVQKDQTKAEADVISDMLVELGIEKDRILPENKSKTTAENFRNAKEIIHNTTKKENPKIAFLSSEYHLLRANLIAKLNGVKADTIPSTTPKNELLKAYTREFVVFLMAFFN